VTTSPGFQAGKTVGNRSAIVTAAVLWAPRLFATPIPQNLGFATTSDGVRIAYATTGAGPPVVYVLGWATHLEDGLGSPVYDVYELLPMSSRRNLFVRYDGRGFGLSDRNVSDFSLDARVRDIEAVVEALELERFAIFAQSAGGPAAIAFTVRHPERVSRLVFAGAMASSRNLDSPGRAQYERVLGLVEMDWGNPAVKLLFATVIRGDLEDEVTRRLVAEFFGRSGTGPAIAAFMRAQLALDVTADARRIQVPTLVIHARDDKTVSLEAGRELASLIPRARLEVVEGGHPEGAGEVPATRARIFEFLNEGQPVSVEP
jgi:pimeloyl-ACP methyl ester carboxylesterase